MTPDQEKAFAAYRDEWFARWSSCEPADRSLTEAAITNLYARVRRQRPEFVWVSSPAEAIATSLRLKEKLRVPVWAAIETSIDAVRNELVSFEATQREAENVRIRAIPPGQWTSVEEAQEQGRQFALTSMPIAERFGFVSHGRVFDSPHLPEDRLSINFHYRFNNSDRGRSRFSELAALSFARDFLGHKFSERTVEDIGVHATIARSVWYWWPFMDACIICDRPSAVSLETERLHSLTGPAVSFRDGWKAYAVRGVFVPPAWIEERDKIPVEAALTWPNIEQRRIAAELIGWARVLEKLSAIVIDENPNPQIGTLLQADLPDSPGERFLKVKCGTGRDFVIPIPREITTALAANAWTYNVTEEQLLKMEVRT